jgi:hypothetical protein
VEEWEEPLHPGSLGATITHFAPRCNPYRTFSPTGQCRGAPRTPVASATIAPMRSPGRSSAPPLAALLLTAAIAGPLAGCGGSQPPDTGIDPAQAVPASAQIYFGAVVRPTGALRTNARAAAQALTPQASPYLHLPGVLQTPGSPTLSFKRDLAAWLGTQAGIFYSSQGAAGAADYGSLRSLLQAVLSGSGTVAFPFAGGGASAGSVPQGAIVLDTTNSTAARSFLGSQAARAGAHPASYRGVAYRATAGGLAFGLVGRFTVIGSEAALQRTIDTHAGGPSLARAGDYARLHALAPAQALAHVYLSAAATAGAAGGRAGASGDLLGLLAGARPANISLLPAAGSLAIDADTLRSSASPASGGLLSADAEAARALGELPSESFVAIGFGSGAAALSQYAQALHSLASPAHPGVEAPGAGISIKGLLAATLAPVNAMTEASAEAKRDFQSWMGPGAVFASGSGLIDLKAGLVIWSKNPAASRAAVAKLAAKLRGSGASVHPVSIPGTDAAVTANLTGLPVAVEIADGRDANGQTKFVIGLGEASVAAAVSPSGALSAAGAYGVASSMLGEGIQPSLIVQVPTLLTLLEGAGLSEDPTIASLVPRLRPLGAVAGGARSLGAGAERFRLVVTLRPR